MGVRCFLLLFVVTVIAGSSSSLHRRTRQAIIFGGPAGPQPSTDCTDYAGRPGTCGVIETCPAFQLVIDNPSTQDVQNIRNSICGSEISAEGRRVLKLCCAVDTSSSVVSTASPISSTSRPAITPGEHPNRHLLPSSPRCGTPSDQRILGGREAIPGEYQFHAALAYQVQGQDELEFNCGGALINPKYVITAAHCVTDLPSAYQLVAVRTDEFRLDSTDDCKIVGGSEFCSHMLQFQIDQVVYHSEYNTPHRFHNDIAIVRLNRPDDVHIPICLPFSDLDDATLRDGTLTVAGFGLTQAFGSSSSVLMEVDVPLVNNSACSDVFRPRGAVIGPSQMCAGGQRDRDSCSGDSGGPLIYTTRFGPPFTAVGVVSYGVTQCGSENVPGVYTRVSKHITWILDNIRP